MSVAVTEVLILCIFTGIGHNEAYLIADKPGMTAMQDTIVTIPLINLGIAFIPVIFALVIFYKWSLNTTNAVYAIVRMVIQLLLIGYLLTYIFQSDSPSVVILILIIMLVSSSWIALRAVAVERTTCFKHVFWAILLGGSLTLLLVSQAVIILDPWYQPQYMIPLAGMIFANAMNSVSLAAERFFSELQRDIPYLEARNRAMHTAMLPVINSLFAVGLVSLPGMMTGQILSGVSPLIAVRYQIVVMCMIFGSSAISSACFLYTTRRLVRHEPE